MQKLLVFQSMWGMERRRPDGLEWSLDEKVRMIADAGFDGASVDFGDENYARKATGLLKNHGLTWQVETFVSTVNELRPIIELHLELGGTHINLLPAVRPSKLEQCIPYIEGWRRLAEDSGVRLHIETHRNQMTTDLLFTLQLLDCFPDLKLEADLSHYLVGREFWHPVSEENHRLVHRILDNSWGLQGRVASREQIQVQITFPHHKHWVDLFLSWWEYGLRSWRRRADSDDSLTFLCELGPKEYAMTGPDGYELSDRWHEAQTLKDMVRGLWHRLETEEVPSQILPLTQERKL
jgi:hypothetical protein